MKKIFALFLAFLLIFSMTSCREEEQQTVEEKHIEISETENYIRLPEGVSEEMLSADFWIDLIPSETIIMAPKGISERMLSENHQANLKASEKIIMTPEEISEFNSLNDKLLSWKNTSIALKDFPETVITDAVRQFVVTPMPDDSLTYYIDGKPVPEEYFEEIDKNRAIDKLNKREVSVRYGYSVKWSELRSYPTDDFCVTEQDDLFYDEFINSQCFPYCPLVVLHESLDREWYYVMFEGFGGWVRTDAVALCRSREDWLKRWENNEFLIVTGREIRLPHDEGCPGVSDLLLPMGTKLPLIKTEEAPEDIRMRTGYGCYTVLVPTRDKYGFIKDEYALVSSAEDVSVGFLPYTEENVIRLAFKLRGDRYGWGSSGFSNDCSGIVRQIYGCLGFTLPRTAGMQISCDGLETFDLSELSDEEKEKTIASLPLGSLLHFSGHIMLYIGTVNGDNYVISSTGAFATTEMEPGTTRYVNTCCVNNLEKTKRQNGDTWLTDMTTAGAFRPVQSE